MLFNISSSPKVAYYNFPSFLCQNVYWIYEGFSTILQRNNSGEIKAFFQAVLNRYL